MSTPQHCPGYEQFKNLKSFTCKCPGCSQEVEIFSDESFFFFERGDFFPVFVEGFIFLFQMLGYFRDFFIVFIIYGMYVLTRDNLKLTDLRSREKSKIE